MTRQIQKEEKIVAFQRMITVLNENGIKKPEFQRTLKIESQDWNNWKNRGLPDKEFIRVSKLLGLNIDWLASGKGEKYSMKIDESNATYAPQLGDYSRVPVVGTAQLGDNGHWCELDYPIGHGDGAINYPTRDKNAYALRCIGDSMKPRIKDGEFVIVEPNTEPTPGDEVLVKAMDGRVMVKIYLYQRDGKVHLMSINEAHPPQTLALEEVDKIHPISAIVKRALWINNDE